MVVDGGVADTERASSVTDCSVEVEIASVVPEIKVHLGNKVEKDCRICHMGLESDIHESGVPIELGCCCKDDLAVAHKHCAETWFKIKGNRTCEICRCVAQNISGPNEESTEHSSNYAITAAIISVPVSPAEPPRFWQGHRFLNFLLACIVFIFVISWLFRIKVPT
ncbi:putative E3 ubiquitin-protein ligase MARCH [Lupinus albus]|uniref:Putative E3 ubiquitin-protein ligase MARCH n=1 Tax=Lupinus albus TaxID=3870 RepID=A0A6A4QXD1_LUPAL|nr:putative E3 ubiquitin-protein ligase MARCH [Lupinus albus]